MSYHRIVLTAGTSALLGSNHFAAGAGQSGLLRIQAPRVLPPEGSAEEESLEAWRAWVDRVPIKGIPLERVSAEISVLRLLQAERRLGGAPVVSLIHSDTFGGEAAALLVARVIEENFQGQVNLRRAHDLDVEHPRKLARSLGGYMAVVDEEIQKGEPGTTCFAPLGGFKVMTALGYVVGCVRGFPMVYVHESKQSLLHTIPPVPVALNTQGLEAYQPLFRQIHREQVVRLETLSSPQHGVLEDHPYLFERTEDEVAFSPFGAFLAVRMLRRRVRVSPQAKAAADHGDTRSLVLAELRDLLARLEDPERHRGTLHHEQSWSVPGTVLSLFKGASGGAGVFRAAYWCDSEGDLHVEHVWTDHAVYERQARDVLGKGRGTAHQEITAAVYGS